MIDSPSSVPRMMNPAVGIRMSVSDFWVNGLYTHQAPFLTINRVGAIIIRSPLPRFDWFPAKL